MTRARWMISLALLLPAGAYADPNAVKQGAWKPKWTAMKAPSENTHLINTPAERIFSPVTAVRITNHLRDEGSQAKEILIGGHESSGTNPANVPTLKLYQESNDRYTRVDIPPAMLRLRAMVNMGGRMQEVDRDMAWQGMGTSGKNVVVAGGSGVSNVLGAEPSDKVFMVDAQTKKIKSLANLKTPRALPMIGSSPSGRYIVVAGGLTATGRTSESSKAIDVIDRVTGQHVDLASKFHGLAEGLPEGRFAGSIAWVQEPGVDRIFFIGGSTAPALGGTGGPLAQEPTKAIHFYDVKEGKWGSMELPTPRMGPAVAVRHLGDGRQEIVVAGGGTGSTSTRPVDPQIYAVERIDPKTLGVKFGESVPEQKGLYTNINDRGGRTAVEWTPNAMVLTNEAGKHGRVSVGARFFGFSNAYKTDPILDHERAAPSVVNINRTTINNVRVEETNQSIHIEQ